jgi:hypothetical protein
MLKGLFEYLEFSEEDAHFYEALNIPEQEDGMTMVRRRGRGVGPHYLFDRWWKGNDAGVFMNEVSPEHQKVWDMDLAARRAYWDRWANALLQEKYPRSLAWHNAFIAVRIAWMSC